MENGMEFVKREAKKDQETVDIAQKLLNWPDCYYLQKNAKIRKQLLDAADAAGLTPEENGFRRRLYEIRYPAKPGPEGTQIDNYLKAWMEMRFMCERSGGFLSKNDPKKCRAVMDSIGYSEADTREKKNLLYEEIHHLGLLYIALCQEDRQYNSVLFGFGKLNEAKQAEKVASEVLSVTKIAPEKYNSVELCDIWTRAIREAYSEMYPDYVGLLG